MYNKFEGSLTLEQIYEACNKYSNGLVPTYDTDREKIKIPYVHDVSSSFGNNKALRRMVENIDRRLRGQANLNKAALIDTPAFDGDFVKKIGEKNFAIRLGMVKVDEATSKFTFIDNPEDVKSRMVAVSRIAHLLEQAGLAIGGIDGELVGKNTSGQAKVQLHVYIFQK